MSPRSGRPWMEAYDLRYYGSDKAKNFSSAGPTNQDQIQGADNEENNDSYQIVNIVPDRSSQSPTNEIDNENSTKPYRYEPYQIFNSDQYPTSRIILSPDQKRKYVCALRRHQALACLIGPDARRETGPIRYLSRKDVRRWNNLADFCREPDLQARANGYDPFAIHSDLGNQISWILQSQNRATQPPFLTLHQSNFPHRLPRLSIIGLFINNYLLILVLVLLPVVYGGIHLAAWKFHFASSIEDLLWKIACIGVMATFVVELALIHCVRFWMRYRRQHYGALLNYLEIVEIAICWIPIIPYVIFRIYLVVESFISLRHAPIGVFATIPWVQTLPFF